MDTVRPELPPPDEQAELLHELATLNRRRGHSTFVSAPLVEWQAEHLPEAFSSSADPRALVRRLLVYAELPPARVHGVVAGRDPVLEVARVFRRHHELDPAGADPEARTLEATAVYLGFGLLLARSTGLSAPAFGFLLAAHQVVRAPRESEQRRVAGLLGEAQARGFAAALPFLAGQELLPRLGLSRSIPWPRPRSAFAGPLPELRAESSTVGDATAQGRHHGTAVFRVHQDATARGTQLGAASGVIVAAAAFHFVAATVLVLLVVAGAVVGYLVGARRGRDLCSEPDCGWLLPPGLNRCLGCGGAVHGRIAHASERFEARARLRRRDFAGR